MPKSLNPNDGKSPEGTAGAKHNVANIEQKLRGAFAETYKLDTSIKANLEKYVAPDRAAKSDIKKKLNAELNITRKLFVVRYAAYRLEADARAAEDTATLETLQMMFSISPVGTQMDFVGGGGSAGNSGDKTPAESKRKKAAKAPVNRGALA
jgi:hypothetical protein